MVDGGGLPGRGPCPICGSVVVVAVEGVMVVVVDPGAADGVVADVVVVDDSAGAGSVLVVVDGIDPGAVVPVAWASAGDATKMEATRSPARNATAGVAPAVRT